MLSVPQAASWACCACAGCERLVVVPAPPDPSRAALGSRPHRSSGRTARRLAVRLEHLSVLYRHSAHAVHLNPRLAPSRKGRPVSSVQLESILTCPKCGAATSETMPTNACQWFHECAACHEVLQPLPGDCCCFCSRSDDRRVGKGLVGTGRLRG